MRIIIDCSLGFWGFQYTLIITAEFMAMSLKNLTVGDLGKIVGFKQSGKAYRKRLLAMGLTPGTEFSVTRFAPMGDPVEIKLRGFSLTLRKDEAAILLIEKL
jgi:ferrous iron transport protein A